LLTFTPRKTFFKTKTYHGPISKEERERRKRENLCLYCGSASHTLDTCPKKGKNNKTTHSFMAIQIKTFRERQTDLIQEQQARARAREVPDQPVVEFDLSCSYQANILIDSGSKFFWVSLASKRCFLRAVKWANQSLARTEALSFKRTSGESIEQFG